MFGNEALATFTFSSVPDLDRHKSLQSAASSVAERHKMWDSNVALESNRPVQVFDDCGYS